MAPFLNTQPNTFGLSINDKSIQLVQFFRSYTQDQRNAKLRTVRGVELPDGLVSRGEITQPEPVRGFIKQLLNNNKDGQGKITGKWTIASIPEEKSFIKITHIPKDADRIETEDVLTEFAHHLPLKPEDYYTDWTILDTEPTEKGVPVMVAAVEKHTADMYTYLIESVGLGVAALDIESLATARAMHKIVEPHPSTMCIIDIGTDTSTAIVCDQNTTQLSHMIGRGGAHFTQALCDALHIEKDAAEAMKRTKDMTTLHHPGWATLSAESDILAREIQKVLSFYQTHFHTGNTVEHIVLTGGGASIEVLAPMIEKKLHIPTTIGNPWKKLSSTKTIKIPKTESLRFATTVGLGLRAAYNPFSKRSLL